MKKSIKLLALTALAIPMLFGTVACGEMQNKNMPQPLPELEQPIDPSTEENGCPDCPDCPECPDGKETPMPEIRSKLQPRVFPHRPKNGRIPLP